MNSSSTMYHYYYYIWIDVDVDVCGGSWVIVHSTHIENNISSRSYFFRCFHSFSHSFLFNFLPPQSNERNTLENKNYNSCILKCLKLKHFFWETAYYLRIFFLTSFVSYREHISFVFRAVVNDDNNLLASNQKERTEELK